MSSNSPPNGGESSDRERSRETCPRTHDRITVRTTDEQLAAIESLVTDDVYPNRSEAIRAGIEAVIDRHAQGEVEERG